MKLELLRRDIKRYGQVNKLISFLTNPMFRYTVIFRLNQSASRWNPLFVPLRIWYKNLSVKYSIQIPVYTKIGGGFLLGHYGGILIGQRVIIGENCNVYQGVSIGNTSRGKSKGFPTIGDRVWIGANSVVVGKITIGNDVLIAPLSFVSFDVPDNAVVAGNPAQIVSYNSSAGYIKNPS
ncbi:DapH/DapD/GlmU-related protein [Flavobacterium enshiense]|uniref:serine O-acetyltransferase n=1 Tax=Flavobacterium enshiense TaxID=1341165 RepID=UPI00345D3673